MMKKKPEPEVIFADLKSQNERTIFITIATVVESMCTHCERNGKTTILMTKIPFFKELIISSFYCEQCGNRNNEVQFGGKLPDFGIQILFRAINKGDLNR